MHNANLIGRIDLFSKTDKTELARIDRRITWFRATAGKIIITQTDASSDVYFVAEGMVRAKWFSPDGKEISFYDFKAGEIFGEFAAVDREVRSSSVVALDSVHLGRMDADQFREIVRTSPEIAWRLIELLVSKARVMSDRVAAFGALAARQRLHQEIVRLSAKASDKGGRMIIEDFPTHQELANRIASHREAVTRELGALSARKIIDVHRGSLEVLNLPRLKQMAQIFEAGVDD